jgi:hypothetical protein
MSLNSMKEGSQLIGRCSMSPMTARSYDFVQVSSKTRNEEMYATGEFVGSTLDPFPSALAFTILGCCPRHLVSCISMLLPSFEAS